MRKNEIQKKMCNHCENRYDSITGECKYVRVIKTLNIARGTAKNEYQCFHLKNL